MKVLAYKGNIYLAQAMPYYSLLARLYNEAVCVRAHAPPIPFNHNPLIIAVS